MECGSILLKLRKFFSAFCLICFCLTSFSNLSLIPSFILQTFNANGAILGYVASIAGPDDNATQALPPANTSTTFVNVDYASTYIITVTLTASGGSAFSSVTVTTSSLPQAGKGWRLEVTDTRLDIYI